jgi:hypothetical protein
MMAIVLCLDASLAGNRYWESTLAQDLPDDVSRPWVFHILKCRSVQCVIPPSLSPPRLPIADVLPRLVC